MLFRRKESVILFIGNIKKIANTDYLILIYCYLIKKGNVSTNRKANYVSRVSSVNIIFKTGAYRFIQPSTSSPY